MISICPARAKDNNINNRRKEMRENFAGDPWWISLRGLSVGRDTCRTDRTRFLDAVWVCWREPVIICLHQFWGSPESSWWSTPLNEVTGMAFLRISPSLYEVLQYNRKDWLCEDLQVGAAPGSPPHSNSASTQSLLISHHTRIYVVLAHHVPPGCYPLIHSSPPMWLPSFPVTSEFITTQMK